MRGLWPFRLQIYPHYGDQEMFLEFWKAAPFSIAFLYDAGYRAGPGTLGFLGQGSKWIPQLIRTVEAATLVRR